MSSCQNVSIHLSIHQQVDLVQTILPSPSHSVGVDHVHQTVFTHGPQRWNHGYWVLGTVDCGSCTEYVLLIPMLPQGHHGFSNVLFSYYPQSLWNVGLQMDFINPPLLLLHTFNIWQSQNLLTQP